MRGKSLFVVAAGLGFRELERRGALKMAGLSFAPGASAFPAVTCVAQATLRTGRDPREHGMTSNGVWLANLAKPSFWEQSAALVEGPRVTSGSSRSASAWTPCSPPRRSTSTAAG